MKGVCSDLQVALKDLKKANRSCDCYTEFRTRVRGLEAYSHLNAMSRSYDRGMALSTDFKGLSPIALVLLQLLPFSLPTAIYSRLVSFCISIDQAVHLSSG